MDAAATDALTEMLANHFAEGGTATGELHDAIASLDVGPGTIELGVSRLTGPPQDALRGTGAWLVRQATDRRAALVGLGLLVLGGTPDDVDMVKTICVLDYFAPTAPRALRNLGASTTDLIWMVERARGATRNELVDELCRHVTDREAREWLLHNVSYDSFASSRARRLAESTALADLVDADAVDDALFCLGAQALLTMATANDYRVEIGKFGDARRMFNALARHAPNVEPTLPTVTAVAGLLQELQSGHAVLLAWEPSERERVLAALRQVATGPLWRSALRHLPDEGDALARGCVQWATGIIDNDGGGPVAKDGLGGFSRLDVTVAVADPRRAEPVETRILVDGRPVLATVFDKGGGQEPERMLAGGDLAATETPREIRLVEAWCTEGCCGALYVTIVRDGDSVIWRDWRGHTSAEPPAELRFHARQYDTEVARAGADHRWEWSARTFARLLRAELRQRPDLLARWRCHLAWVGAWTNEPHQARLSFDFPETLMEAERGGRPWLQFTKTIAINETPVDEQVARALDGLASADPKDTAAVVGGSREHAAALGYTWPWTTG